MTEKISGRFNVVFLLKLKILILKTPQIFKFYGWYSIVFFVFRTLTLRRVRRYVDSGDAESDDTSAKIEVSRLNQLQQGLNMELDLQSLLGLHVHSCTHWLRPLIWAHIRGRYW